MKKYLPYLLSAFIGGIVWVGIGAIDEVNEAWDSPLYLFAGLPVMAISVILISGVWPDKPWLWAILMVSVQAVLLFSQSDSSFNLWPLTVLSFLVFFLIFIALANLGAIIRKQIIDKKLPNKLHKTRDALKRTP